MERLFEKNGYLNAEGKILGLNEFKLFTDLKNGDVIEERFKKGLIERAEKILDKEYPVCRATDYMMFTRTGDRLAYSSRTYLKGEDLVILQITDTQLQSLKGARNTTRRTQISNAFFANGLGRTHTQRVWRYADEAVERVKPDLIVLTGDNIYGELDDSGEMWLELIEKMDSYGIPWCVVFGNHDNESGKGVRWQVEQLEKSEYCVFRQGSVSGNSNYNLLIRQGGEAKYCSICWTPTAVRSSPPIRARA